MREVYDIVNVFSNFVERDSNIDDLFIELRKNAVINAFFNEMENTMQNEEFHGEKDVYTHTKMVVDKLLSMDDFYKFSKDERIELLIAAVFHDIGKIKTTRVDEGKIVSPHHAQKGEMMIRKFLWRSCDLAGTSKKQDIRENICALVRYHMLPYYLIENKDTFLRMVEISMLGELVKGFTIEKLCLLSQADAMGRIAKDSEKSVEQIQMTMMYAKEEDCLDKPYEFSDLHTRRAFFKGRDVYPKQSLYDDTWGTVYVMVGIAGTGKDTWISNNLSNLPMISLDEIRKKLGIKPTDSQGRVIQYARECAKEYLRKKQSFVWNATNITKDMRKKIINLFENYNANVTIIYLETDWQKQLDRNNERNEEKVVPLDVIQRMQSQLQPPTINEATSVNWYCI